MTKRGPCIAFIMTALNLTLFRLDYMDARSLIYPLVSGRVSGRVSRHPFRFIVFALFVFIALVSSAFGTQIQGQIPAENQTRQEHVKTAQYTIEYRGQHVGMLDAEIVHHGKSLMVKTSTKLRFIARLFLDEQVVTTTFQTTQGGLKLSHGVYFKKGAREPYREFTVDEARGAITFQSYPTETYRPQDVLEANNFPTLLMMADNPEDISGQVVKVLNGKLARRCQYRTVVTETMTFGGREIRAWKIVRERQEDPKRTMTFWVEQGANRLPIKIVSTKNNQHIVLTRIEEGESAGSE